MPILALLPISSSLWKTCMLIDTSDNASHNQDHWLIRTPYLSIKASNEVDLCLPFCLLVVFLTPLVFGQFGLNFSWFSFPFAIDRLKWPFEDIIQLKVSVIAFDFYEVCEGYVFTGVCLSTGIPGVSQHAMGQTPPLRTRGRHPPRADTHTPWEDTPKQTSPCPVHARIQSTSRRYTSRWNAFLFLIWLFRQAYFISIWVIFI